MYSSSVLLHSPSTSIHHVAHVRYDGQRYAARYAVGFMLGNLIIDHFPDPAEGDSDLDLDHVDNRERIHCVFYPLLRLARVFSQPDFRRAA